MRVIKDHSIPEFSNSNNYIIKYYNKTNILINIIIIFITLVIEFIIYIIKIIIKHIKITII